MNSNREPTTAKPLIVLGVASSAMALAWRFTPVWGPWWCHGIAEPLSLLTVLRWGRIQAQTRATRWGFSALAVGALLALVSWYGVPVATRLIPSIGHELQNLYLTLRKPPGPAKAVPILVLTILNEELVWRSALFDWCQERLTALQIVLVTTAAYALPMVASGSPLLVTVAVMVGCLLGAERLIFRTWMAPFVTHLTWSLLVFVLRPLA